MVRNPVPPPLPSATGDPGGSPGAGGRHGHSVERRPCGTPSARAGRRGPRSGESWPSRRRRCTTPSTPWPAPTKSTWSMPWPTRRRRGKRPSRRRRTGPWSRFYPAQAAALDAKLAASLATIPDGKAEDDGVALGRSVADQILALRQNDGSGVVLPPYLGSTDPGKWRPTPSANLPGLLPGLADVTPFAMTSNDQFRPDRAAGARQRRLHRGLQRGEGTRLRHQRHAHGRPGGYCPVLGQRRRHCGGERPPEPPGPDRRPTAGQHAGRERPAVRGAQHRHGRRRHQLLGRQVRVQLLAAGHRHPRGRERRQPGHRGRRGLDPAAGHAQLPGVHLGPQHGQRRRRRRSWPTSSAPTTSPTRSRRRTPPSPPAPTPASPRRRKSRPSAGSTAASTGASTTTSA